MKEDFENDIYKDSIEVDPTTHTPKKDTILINVDDAAIQHHVSTKLQKFALFGENTYELRKEVLDLILNIFKNDIEIICDETNNTQEIIDNNQLAIDIVLKVKSE